MLRSDMTPAACAQGARRLTFERFLDALALLAERKGASLADLAGAVLAARGPCVSGTRADYVKFHDDKARPRTQPGPGSAGAGGLAATPSHQHSARTTALIACSAGAVVPAASRLTSTPCHIHALI